MKLLIAILLLSVAGQAQTKPDTHFGWNIEPPCKKGFTYDSDFDMCTRHYTDTSGNDCWTGQDHMGGGCSNPKGIKLPSGEQDMAKSDGQTLQAQSGSDTRIQTPPVPEQKTITCELYMHNQHTPAHCANTCAPDGGACYANCLYVAAEDKCVDDIRVVTERDWAELMKRLADLEAKK